MEKLVLIPYDKYQRMLNTPHDYQVEEQKTKKESVMTPTKQSDIKSKKKRKLTDIVVKPPPPGKRDTTANLKTDKFMDWISF